MEQFEKVEKLKEKANVSYEMAKQALEENNWDLLDAIIALEKQGSVEEPKTSHFTTKTEAIDEAVSGEKDTGKKGKSMMRKFLDVFLVLVRKANRNSLEIVKDEKVVVSVPVSIFVLLLLCCFWVVVPLMIVGLFFSMRYHFEGPDIHAVDVDINVAMDTVARTAETIKSEFTKEDEKESKD